MMSLWSRSQPPCDPRLHIELSVGEGGLKQVSMVKCEQVTTLDKSFLLRGPFAGTISAEKMHEIEKGVQRAIGILVP